ncbi:transcriptional regulatory [Fusarium pseudocircinatum]|uniref:Transcriptional regulatory n=1 Tax=Fusarium pseudocircinatum TaxID=56676 RepID=A0A8H5LDH5_9HYPO|nr:transcriptional regulatory [Fusarium pseudocircinatum]
MKSNQRKVSRACERCRKQKLKCDVERPCTLCSRANTECIASGSARWRPYQGAPEQAAATNSSVKNEPGTTVGSAIESAWNSSSTVKLVEEVKAFKQHDSASPEGVEFSALRSETWAQSEATAQDSTKNIETNINERPKDVQPRQGNISSKLSAAEKELMSLLPDIGPATLLVDNYFDRIHWFILVFHQDDFRNRFQDLYNRTTFPSGPRGIGFVAVSLAVLAISLHHIGAQESKLKSYNIDPEQLKSRILDSLKSRFLNIVSRGSLEAVQFCVLLASYYLYHGEPGMAWPLSGSGLRIAQALNLHRKMSPGDPSDQVLQQQIQDGKRAWWAVYEIDTFCSMLYGFPLGFSDSDCNVDPLDSYDQYSRSTKESHHSRVTSLLFYKCSMSRLSVIIKSALLELYGTRHSDREKGDNFKGLTDKVATLNGRLEEWRRKLARKLIFDGYGPSSQFQAPHGRERTKREFENYLFCLQALSLKLAYENTKILIHRPLLSFRKASATSKDIIISMTNPFHVAMQECKEAALQISRVASTPYLLEASETYAIAVVSLHLLTAGVTLCISITLDPLAPDSAEVRSRIRQLMEVQTLLKDKSIVAAQSLDITKRLASLVMAKTGSERLETGVLSSAYPEVPQRDRSRNDFKVSDWGGSAEATMSEAKVDFNSAYATNNGSITDTLSMHFADQDMDVSSDTLLNDTLLEYEQAASRLFTGDITYDPSDSILDNPFLEQNQGWIWSWNFLD